MKVVNVILLIAFFSFSLIAQDAKFESAMKKGLEQLNAAQTLEDFQKAANLFERIAGAEPEQWLPTYYESYAQMRMAAQSFQQQQLEQCQAHLDKAQTALDKAKKIAPEESEVYALQGFIYQGRIWEDPQTKGAEFSPLSQQVLDKAIQLDPENPRAYYLKGQLVFHTPEFWGGGAENALPILQKAQEKYQSAKSANDLAPGWGQETNAYFLKKALEAVEANR